MTDVLISVHDVHKRFVRPRTPRQIIRREKAAVVAALNGLNLTVKRGETLAIVGESGCGKSTLARCLVRLHTPDEGQVLYAGQNIAALDGAARRVQMVFQDPYGSLNPRKTIFRQIAEPIWVHGLRHRADVDQRVHDLLAMVGLPADTAGRYPHSFSGGQLQRISIARALALEPECLIADEIVSALDVSVQAQIINLLLDLQRTLALTIVFVSHDLQLVRYLGQRVAVMYLGRVVELGSGEQIFGAPLHPYTQALIAASPNLDFERKQVPAAVRGELPSPLAVPSGCAFHPRCPLAIARCRDEAPSERESNGHRVACHLATL